MLKFLGYLIALISGLALGIVGMIAAMGPLPPTIQVEIHNTSSQPVSNIIITHEDGTVSIRTLDSGATQAIPVLVHGESSYHIQATLASGEVVRGQGGYVEPGYKLLEKITATGIEHELQSFY